MYDLSILQRVILHDKREIGVRIFLFVVMKGGGGQNVCIFAGYHY